MREYRAKKKAEKQSQSEDTIKIKENQNIEEENVEHNLEDNLSKQLTTLIMEDTNN